MQQIRESIVQLSEEKKPFTFEDHRQPVTESPEPSLHHTKGQGTNIGQGVSINEAVSKYFGSLDKVSAPSTPLSSFKLQQMVSRAPPPKRKLELDSEAEEEEQKVRTREPG